MASWDWPGSLITRVIDGDTLDALVTRDLGFGGRVIFPIRLRLNRINAPARNTLPGAASWGFLLNLLPLNVPTTLTTLAPYKYGGPAAATGEWMTEIMTADGRNVSDVMVASGFAVYWDGQGPRPQDQ